MARLITVTFWAFFLLSTSNVLGQTSDAPVGAVIAWLKDFANTPPIPSGWLECNGQVVIDPSSPYNGQSLPNLNGRFLRGSASSGATGGSDEHNHQWMFQHWATSMQNGGWEEWNRYANTWDFDGINLHPADTDVSDGEHHYTKNNIALPTYYEVVWIMRIKPPVPFGAPAVSIWGLMILSGLVLSVGSIIVRKTSPLAA